MSTMTAPDGFARIDDATKMECKICWYLYDPADGDPVEQIEPGTPFRTLPDYWRCPQCDAEPSAFIPVTDEN
jgi:rubredoxin